MKTILLTALITSALTILAMIASGYASLPTRTLLENPKVRVLETTYAPGTPRDRHIRSTDQVIVFLDDCKYERIDSKTKEKTVRERKSGDVIWHDKGEDAPVLINAGTKPYRTLTIELK
jgi:hypothetical protein